MVAFIFVHGTFSLSADWPGLRRGLSEVFDDGGKVPRFVEVPWSGKNTVTARETAASAILSAIATIRSESEDEAIFIIGHSHGGSAVAYFIKYSSSLARNITGFAFLSTPFVAIRRRAAAFITMMAVLLYPLVAANYIIYKVYKMHRAANDVAMSWLGWVLELGIFLSPSVIVFSVVFMTFRAQRSAISTIQKQTTDLPDGNYLFLRCSGDEAAAALSAVQFFNWLGMRASNIMQRLCSPMYEGGFISSMCVALVFFMLLPMVFDFSAFTVIPLIKQAGLFNLMISIPQRTLGYSLTLLAMLLCLIVALLSLALPLLAFAALLMQALTSWAFGWTRFFHGFVVELAVEPLPFGKHALINIDWKIWPFHLDGIVHSWTYSHPIAILHIQDWVKQTLGLDSSVKQQTDNK